MKRWLSRSAATAEGSGQVGCGPAASRLQVLTHLPKEMERKNEYELRVF